MIEEMSWVDGVMGLLKKHKIKERENDEFFRERKKREERGSGRLWGVVRGVEIGKEEGEKGGEFKAQMNYEGGILEKKDA